MTAKIFLIPSANHFEANVKNMPVGIKVEFATAVRKMLGMEANIDALKLSLLLSCKKHGSKPVDSAARPQETAGLTGTYQLLSKKQ